MNELLSPEKDKIHLPKPSYPIRTSFSNDAISCMALSYKTQNIVLCNKEFIPNSFACQVFF